MFERNHDMQYLYVATDILTNGYDKDDRTGVGTRSTFGQHMRFSLRDGQLPILTTKKVFTKGIIHELLWMLSGDTNIRYLKDHGVSIWDSWVKPETAEFSHMTETEMVKALTDYYRRKSYTQVKIEVMDDPQLELSWCYELDGEDGITVVIDRSRIVEAYTDITGKKPEKLIAGELPKIYQHQWRKWDDTRIVPACDSDHYLKRGFKIRGHVDPENVVVQREIDQIAYLVNRIKTNPDCRRLIGSAWNVAEIEDMALPPCHALFQFWTRLLDKTERMLWMANNRPELCDEFNKLWLENENDDGDQSPENEAKIVQWLDDRNIPQRAISCQLYQR